MSAPSAALRANRWGSQLVNAGTLGHINADSGLCDWQFGQVHLKALAELARCRELRFLDLI